MVLRPPAPTSSAMWPGHWESATRTGRSPIGGSALSAVTAVGPLAAGNAAPSELPVPRPREETFGVVRSKAMRGRPLVPYVRAAPKIDPIAITHSINLLRVVSFCIVYALVALSEHRESIAARHVRFLED